MRSRQKIPRPGDLLPVNDSSFHYALPPGLTPGTIVKLLSFDHGYWTVEAHGQQFQVFMTRIDSGWEQEVNGRWQGPDSTPSCPGIQREV